MAGAQQGHGMLYVNRPLFIYYMLLEIVLLLTQTINKTGHIS